MCIKNLPPVKEFIADFNKNVEKAVSKGDDRTDARIVNLLLLIYNLNVETKSTLQFLDEFKIILKATLEAE